MNMNMCEKNVHVSPLNANGSILRESRQIEDYIYCLSHKTVNSGENFWIVYCFTTNQMQDETAKGNCQTAALISHDLMQNNELAFLSTRNLQNTEIFLS